MRRLFQTNAKAQAKKSRSKEVLLEFNFIFNNNAYANIYNQLWRFDVHVDYPRCQRNEPSTGKINLEEEKQTPTNLKMTEID